MFFFAVNILMFYKLVTFFEDILNFLHNQDFTCVKLSAKRTYLDSLFSEFSNFSNIDKNISTLSFAFPKFLVIKTLN